MKIKKSKCLNCQSNNIINSKKNNNLGIVVRFEHQFVIDNS